MVLFSVTDYVKNLPLEVRVTTGLVIFTLSWEVLLTATSVLKNNPARFT
jgi:hypothetical protein